MGVLDALKNTGKDLGKANMRGLTGYGPGQLGSDILDLGVKKGIGLTEMGDNINKDLKKSYARRVLSKQIASAIFVTLGRMAGAGEDSPRRKLMDQYAAASIGSLESDLVFQIARKTTSGLAAGADVKELAGTTMNQAAPLGGQRETGTQDHTPKKRGGILGGRGREFSKQTGANTSKSALSGR